MAAPKTRPPGTNQAGKGNVILFGGGLLVCLHNPRQIAGAQRLKGNLPFGQFACVYQLN